MKFLSAGSTARRATGAMLCLGLLWGASSLALAQIGQDSIPSAIYLKSFPVFYEGEYSDSLATYVSESRGAIKAGQMRWIDSICYYTMAGECHYQMGRLGLALEQYNAALRLYLQHSDWMMSVDFPPIRPAGLGGRPLVPWGASKRGAALGTFPVSQSMGQGRVNNAAAFKFGGTVQRAMLFTVHAGEIVRCTTLAMRRRREILGPICMHDALAKELLDAFSRRPGPPRTWAESWLDLQLGVAYASTGNPAQAISALRNSLLAGGQFDHPLTSTALLELGRLAMEAGEFPAAATYFEEATYAAVAFADAGVLEEAFRHGQLNHLLANQKGLYPPLTPAIGWARVKGLRHLLASLELLQAENLAVTGATPMALAVLGDARAVIGRSRDLSNGSIGARLNYLTAVTAYQAGNVVAGDQALRGALAYQQGGSFWLFQLAMADKLAMSGQFSQRTASQLYEILLRDPTPFDWATSPLEALSSITVPHPLPLEHWFEMVFQNKREQDKALEIADRARRHRFYCTLPMGGRLLALRWILEGPKELLTDRANLQRQELLVHYPKYAALAQAAAKHRANLENMKLVNDAADARRVQENELSALGQIGQAQEVILREMAVRREPADMVFPPVRKTKELQEHLPPGHLLLAFFATHNDLYAFLYSRDKYTAWRISSPAKLRKQLMTLLTQLGNYERNHELASNDLVSGQWKTFAAIVYDSLLDKSSADLSATFDELAIVPDGALWYLPFEALPIGRKPDQSKPLLSRVRIRYAPTASLAVPYSSVSKPSPVIGVVVGKLYPRDDAAIAENAFSNLSKVVPGAVALPNHLPAASSLYRDLLDGLVVLDDVEPADSGPYEWSPAQIDRGKAGSNLSAWFSLPWGGLDYVILPGFHSAAESGMKKRAGDGNDLFLSICGLMSTGVRTILISRWRSGGQTSFDLVRELVQELPHTSPADAWQRSVQVVSDNVLDPEAEPRLKRFSANVQPQKADHPFFWAGYMLVDSGRLPADADKKPPQVIDLRDQAKDPAPKPADIVPAPKKVEGDIEPPRDDEPNDAPRAPNSKRRDLKRLQKQQP